MEDWLKISLLLCTFGFFREMRPSEPFVTEYLSGKWRNITVEQVNRSIYPMGTYSCLGQLVVIFLITDMLRYKPIIVLSACIGIILWSIVLWTYNLLGLQISQLFYGTFKSAEIAYFTYIYAKVKKEKYQKVTGHSRAASLSGRFVGCVLGQLFISYELLDFRELNYVSLGTQIISLVFAFLLPSAEGSLYFYSEQNPDSTVPKYNVACKKLSISITNIRGEIDLTTLELPIPNRSQFQKRKSIYSREEDDNQPKFSLHNGIKKFWKHIRGAYSNPIVAQWSIWWSLAMCGYLQVASYIQLLWKQIDPNHENLYNGAVEAALTLLGAISSFGAGFMNSSLHHKWDFWILTLCSLLEGCFLLWSALTTAVWISYIMYVLFGALYFFMITIASAIVAKNLIEDSFGLIFGINTLFALIFQTIFTIVVISNENLGLDSRGQNITFGGYFIVLSILYGISGIIFSIIKWRKSKQQLEVTNLY